MRYSEVEKAFEELLCEMRNRFNDLYKIDQIADMENKNASALDYFLWTHEEVMQNTEQKFVVTKPEEPPKPQPDKYAVAFTGHHAKSGLTRQFLEVIEANDCEKAVGKFLVKFHDPDFFLGAFKATKVSV